MSMIFLIVHITPLQQCSFENKEMAHNEECDLYHNQEKGIVGVGLFSYISKILIFYVEWQRWISLESLAEYSHQFLHVIA